MNPPPDFLDLASLPEIGLPAFPAPGTRPVAGGAVVPRPVNQPGTGTPDVPFSLPDGTPLVLSLMVEAHVMQAFSPEGFMAGIDNIYAAYVLLWMCANPKQPGQTAVWEARGHCATTGAVLPLYLRSADLIEAALDWFEARKLPADATGYLILANHLWNHHHAAEVVPDPTPEEGSIPEKKNQAASTPTRLTKSSTSSPAGISASGKKSSTARRSESPSPRGTATSSTSASAASPRRNSTAAAPPPRSASGTRGK